MPRLLQLNVCVNVGSTGRIVEQIGRCAINSGWESYIVAGREIRNSVSNVIKCGNIIGVLEHFVENRLLDNEGLASRIATKKVIKTIQRLHPDIVQIHNVHDHWLNYRLLFNYLNQTDIKVVWTFHDCWAFTGHCYHFVSKNCCRWETGCFDCPLHNKYGLDRSKRNYHLKKSLFAANKNLTIVSCSEWMGDFVKRSFLHNANQKVLYNGIDLNVFKPNLEPNRGDKFRVIAVSNVWLPYKGINDIYKLRQLLSDDYEIVVAGLSKSQIQSLPKGVMGIQKTQNVQELVSLYSSADVLVNPTYADTFPTVNLEALACGTPVITYRTGGSPEAVDKQTGIVVEQGSLNALCSAIDKVRTNGKNHYTIACRKRAEACFDKDKCFNQYIELYNELIR